DRVNRLLMSRRCGHECLSIGSRYAVRESGSGQGRAQKSELFMIAVEAASLSIIFVLPHSFHNPISPVPAGIVASDLSLFWITIPSWVTNVSARSAERAQQKTGQGHEMQQGPRTTTSVGLV